MMMLKASDTIFENILIENEVLKPEMDSNSPHLAYTREDRKKLSVIIGLLET